MQQIQAPIEYARQGDASVDWAHEGAAADHVTMAVREGDEVAGRKRNALAVLELTRVSYRFDNPLTPAGVVEFFRANYGPTARAFAALGEADRTALRADLVDLWASHNQTTEPDRTIVDAEYLEVVGVGA